MRLDCKKVFNIMGISRKKGLKLKMKEIVYFKICDNEEEYKKIRPYQITKYKLLNTIIKNIYHYKFIIMSKYNLIERTMYNQKDTFIIYMKQGKNEEKVLKNINSMIIKITYENKNIKVIISKKIKQLIEKHKKLHNIKKLYSILQDNINNKDIYIDFLDEIIKSVIKLRKEEPEEQSMYILMNSNSVKCKSLLNKIIPNYKMTNIVTQNINELKAIEKNAEENFEPVSVLNNKRKSIARAKYIINADFEDKDFENYCINRTAIIFNINDTKINSLKNFDGIIINNINIKKEGQEFDLKDEYIENKLYANLILENIEKHKFELEGNNGKIEFKEFI